MAFSAVVMAFTLACGDSGSKENDGGTPDGSAGAGGKTGGAGGKGGGSVVGGAGGGTGAVGGAAGASAGAGGRGGAATGGVAGSGGSPIAGAGGAATGGVGGKGGSATGGSTGGSTGGAGGGGRGGSATGGNVGGSTGGNIGGSPSGGIGGGATGGGAIAGSPTGGVGGAGGGPAPTPANLSGWVTEIDLGKTLCGNAPAARTFTLSNSGGTAAKITAATFSGATGWITDALNKTIPAGGSLVVGIAGPSIPSVSAVPGNYQGSVTFQTDVPGDTAHTVTLKEAASGAVLQLEVAQDFGSFGTVAASQTAQQTYRLTNTGDVTAMLTGSAQAPFSVDPAITVVAGNSFDGTVTFDAGTVPGDKVGVLSFAASTTLCSALPANSNLTAKTLNGGLTLSATSVTLSPSCNDPNLVSGAFTVTNNGNAPITFASSLDNGVVGTTPASGVNPAFGNAVTVQPGDVSTVVIQQLATLTAPTVLTDQITLTTTGITGDTAHAVQVRVVPKGDVVTVATPGGLDFGQVPIITPAQTGTLPIVFENRANASSAPAQITLNLTGNGTLFTLDRTTFTIAPNTTETVNVTFAPGTDKTILGNATSLAFNTSIGWTIGGEPNCAGAPGASGTVALQGTATAAVVAINPSSLVFGQGGLVNCGAQATPQTITLSNPGANQYTVRNVTLNHIYYEAPALSGAVVAPGGSQTITVTPKQLPATWGVIPDGTSAIPGGFFNGTLTFETDAPNDTPHSIPLFMGLKGVVITGAPPSQTQYNFRDATVGNSSYFSFSVVNTGNATAEASFRTQNLSGIFGITPSPTTIAPGQLGTGPIGNTGPVSTTLRLFYQPTAAASTNVDQAFVKITPSAGNVFCQPLPAAWQALDTTGVAVQGSSP